MSEMIEIVETRPKPRKFFKSALVIHSKALLAKNFFIFLRNKTASFIQLACPTLVCLYLLFIQGVVNDYIAGTTDADPSIYSSTIPKCWGSGCVTLAIVIAGNRTEWADFVIAHISENTGLKLNSDIVVTEQSSLSFFDYLSEHQNKTQTGLILCTSEFLLPENPLIGSIPCQSYNSTGYFYSIVFNYTSIMYQQYSSQAPHMFSEGAIGAKMVVDNAILAYESSQLSTDSPQLQSSYQLSLIHI